MTLIPIFTIIISLFMAYHCNKKKRALMPSGRLPEIWAMDNWYAFWWFVALVVALGLLVYWLA
jgi:hypothetical protein